jgi:hypothetical protein
MRFTFRMGSAGWSRAIRCKNRNRSIGSLIRRARHSIIGANTGLGKLFCTLCFRRYIDRRISPKTLYILSAGIGDLS